jgi:hypothetical protein
MTKMGAGILSEEDIGARSELGPSSTRRAAGPMSTPHTEVGLRGPGDLRPDLIRRREVNLVRAMRRANNLSPKLDAGGDRCERV